VNTIVLNLEHIEEAKAKQQFARFMKKICEIDINSKIKPIQDVSKILYETAEPILIKLVQQYNLKIDAIKELYEEIKKLYTADDLDMIKISPLLIELKSKVDSLYMDVGLGLRL